MRVLLANESFEPLERIAPLVRAAGHEVVATEVDEHRVLTRVAEHHAEVAAVAFDHDRDHALRLVGRLGASAPCPIVLWTGDDEPALARAALHRGAAAYAARRTSGALAAAIDFAAHRHRELALLRRRLADLEGAAAQRATVEQAKGVLMARHEIGAREAYALIRGEARSRRVSVGEVAESVLRVHRLI